MTFNRISEKRETVIELLCTVDRRRRVYTFYIATCYFTSKQIEIFVAEISSQISIHKIYLYLDKMNCNPVIRE